MSGVYISPFISNLPSSDASTTKWNTDDASGSTIMAACLIEVWLTVWLTRSVTEPSLLISEPAFAFR